MTIPVRAQLAWLLLGVPAGVGVFVSSMTHGSYVGGSLCLFVNVLIVVFCAIVFGRKIPAIIVSDAGLEFPIVRIRVPWADVVAAEMRHKGQHLTLTLREGGGVRLPRGGVGAGRPLTQKSLHLPQLLLGKPLAALMEQFAAHGVVIAQPPFRQRTTRLERTAIGEGLVLLALSSQKGHHNYQTAYFWSGVAVAAFSFIDRRSPALTTALLVAVNLFVLGFVFSVTGPTELVRVSALFTVSLSTGGVLSVINRPGQRKPTQFPTPDSSVE